MFTGYIDEVGILAWVKNTEQTCDAVGKTLQKAQRWASIHASVFSPNKFQLTHFPRPHKLVDIKKPVQTEWDEVKPKKTCKILRLSTETKLLWNLQIENIRQKAMKIVAALSCLGGPNWGVS